MSPVTRLHELFDRQGQSPWIDDLSRGGLRSGRLTALVGQGVRGATSNPTIFQKAMAGSQDYDEQFRGLLGSTPVEEAFWEMAFSDVGAALDVLEPVHSASGGADGFVSLELAPGLAHDTAGSIEAARAFHRRVDAPNLLVKIPGTAEGVPAVQAMVAEGHSINVTLIFSLERYGEVIEAYLAGLEALPGDLSGVAGVASFFVSRVDTEVDRRLDAVGTAGAAALRGRVALAQAKLAYELFTESFAGPRWEALEARGARCQRPLWASTSTKDPSYPDLLYVDQLIGPDTVNTMPAATLEAFLDHGTVERTVDRDLDGARATLDALDGLGVDLADVSATLEAEGVASFVKSYDQLLQALHDKARELAP